MPAYCEVALPVPLDRTFTYQVRDGQRPQRGGRVIVPFRNEKLIGIVTRLSDQAPTDFEVRYLEAVLDEVHPTDLDLSTETPEEGGPLLSEHLLQLGEWMAQYYLAPLGEVLRGMLPLMAEVRRVIYYRITDLGRDVLAASVDGASPLSHPGHKQKNVARAGNSDLEAAKRVLERLARGEAVRVSTLRTATGATLPLLASMGRKKWITRETAAMERDARRTERFVILLPGTRLPRLTAKQQAILA